MARKKAIPRRVVETNETNEECFSNDEEAASDKNDETSIATAKLRKPPPEKFVHDGHMYTFIKVSKDGKKKYWRCDKRGIGCKVRIHTDIRTNQIVKQKNEHVHVGDEKDVIVKRLKAMVKVKAHQTKDKAAKIIKSSLLEIPNGSSFKLDRLERRNLSKIVHRERRLASNTIKMEAPGITVGSEVSHSVTHTPPMRRTPPAKFFHDGYTYNFIKKNRSGAKNIWRCVKRAGGCRVRIHTDINTNEILNVRNVHNHEADEKDVEMRRLKAIIKVKALQTIDAPLKVIDDGLLELPHGLELNFQQRCSLVKLITRERKLASWTVKVDAPNTDTGFPMIDDEEIDDDDGDDVQMSLVVARINTKTPYKCGICKKGFVASSYLNAHMARTHTGEKPLSCPKCDERFNNESILRRHVKSC